MSDNDFLKTLSQHLAKGIITIVLAFIGTLIVTVFTVKGLSNDVQNLQATKADKATVESELRGISRQLDEMEDEIKTNQGRIIDLLKDKK